ncbi:serine/threonine-protein kinase WAG2-like [Tasmannia lanceolata]|uniref:serine/threonine-protein kinase WAG2-like n=1 Tax=Tasmannia lanceolata TaxID=3420 RepID=UPI004062F207
MEIETHFPSDSDLDFSFTSSTSTFTSSSARTSLSSTPPRNSSSKTHRKNDPHWSAILAAGNLSSSGHLSLSLGHLHLLRHLGTGNLGRVFLCRLKHDENALFALKVVDRDALSAKKLSQVEMEAQVLASLAHPFLPTLYAHLEISHYTCLLIDYCPGGDLHSLLLKQPRHRFPVDSVRFYAAEVLLALEYLHVLGFVYRDLKPENVLRRGDGHVMLSDFDLCFRGEVVPTVRTRARKIVGPTSNCGCFRSGRDGEEVTVTEFVAEPTEAFSKSCVGTHEYLAPEMVNGNGHGNGVDWWAFGVFVYELLYGRTPFKGGSKEGTLRNIVTSGVSYPEDDDVAGYKEARDLTGRLLVKDPRRRLGCARGATDIKRHPFFDGIKWPLMRDYCPPGMRRHVAENRRGRWSWKGYFGKKRYRSWSNGAKWA